MTIKEQLIQLISEHGTTPVVLDKETLETSALYYFEKDIFCLKDGMDFPFDDISDKGQADILVEVKAKAFTLDPSFCG